jgi:hypothetical protein
MCSFVMRLWALQNMHGMALTVEVNSQAGRRNGTLKDTAGHM